MWLFAMIVHFVIEVWNLAKLLISIKVIILAIGPFLIRNLIRIN